MGWKEIVFTFYNWGESMTTISCPGGVDKSTPSFSTPRVLFLGYVPELIEEDLGLKVDLL